MNDNVNISNGQLYLNLSVPVDVSCSPYYKALGMLLGNLDYTCFYSREKKKAGRPFALHPMRMIWLIVYGILNGCCTSRDIENLARRDLVCLKELDCTVPDHSTITRFIVNNHDNIQDIFGQLARKLHGLNELDAKCLFQDGTKIESVSNRYRWVWKGAIEKDLDRGIEKLQLVSDYLVLGFTVTRENLGEFRDLVEDWMQKNMIRYRECGGKGRGRGLTVEQKIWVHVRTEIPKFVRYKEWMDLMASQKRNSLSKTDMDATFMRMKEDHMKNGQLKPGYNMQNVVSNGYIVATVGLRDRNDCYAMIPAMERAYALFGDVVERYCADSGYDCKENYKWLEEHGIACYIKGRYYEQDKSRRNRKDPSLKQNYSYDAGKDEFRCMRGHRLVNVGKAGKRGETSYKCTRGCKSCPLRTQCMKSAAKKLDYKVLTLDVQTELYRRESLRNITTHEGCEIRANRSIQAEGSFALIKNVFQTRRFHYKGMDNTETEWTLFCMAENVLRFSHRLRQNKTGTPFWYRIEPHPEEEQAS